MHKLNLSINYCKQFSDYVRQNANLIAFDNSESWVVLSPIEMQIKEKIERIGTPLKEWDISINYGIKTGFNEAFIINGEKRKELIEEDPKSDEIIRPLLRGRDIKKYSYNFDERYLIATFPSRNYNIDDFPAVKQFLIGFYPKIKQTGENLSNEEINAVMNHAKKEGIQINDNSLQKSRKRTTNKWFETQDSISYWEDFYKQKIIWKAVGRNLAFSISEEGTFLTAPASFITSNLNYYILAFLSSSFGRYYIYNNSDRTGAGDIMLNIQSLERIPIPEPTVENEKKINELISQILDYKQNGIKTDNIESEIDKLIYDVFEFNTEEIEFIETE